MAEPQPEKSKRKAPGRPFEKGKPGGPGRPKGSVSIVAGFKRKLAQVDPKTGRELVDEFVDRVWEMALNGNERMACEIIRHVDGMPRQHIDLAADEGALTLVWPASTLKGESHNGNEHNGNGNGHGATNRIASADSGAGNGSH